MAWACGVVLTVVRPLGRGILVRVVVYRGICTRLGGIVGQDSVGLGRGVGVTSVSIGAVRLALCDCESGACGKW